jgi:uncharacterized protein (DUF58 family)
MNSLLVEGKLAARKREVARLAEKVYLPFRSRAWRGSSGSWQGRSQGSSIDFQDHREYAPGDDPRYLDWAAYARTNNYIMKLFREEVSPRLDVVLDISHSMFLTSEKEARSLDLFALVLSTALHDGTSLRIYAAHSVGHWRRLETVAAMTLESMPKFGSIDDKVKVSQLPLTEIPWRAGSLRVLISDLLVPQPPERELASLGREHGRVVLIAPYLQIEANPDWRGNLELHDCETKQIRQQRVEPFLLSRYQKNYQRHFELWQEEARRRDVPFARISCELSLSVAVRQQALPAGAFEVRH